MRSGRQPQSGYTLIEIVLVIALSAVFIIMVIQNSSTSQSTQRFVAAIEKIKSLIHDAQTQGNSGEASSDNIGGFICGTRLRLNSNGSYQIWRIYGSGDSGTGGSLTYQSVTGGINQNITPTPMDIQSQALSSDPTKNPDGTFAGSPVSQSVDLVFLGAIPNAPIGQAYIYFDPSQEPANGLNGSGNCSDFASQATASSIYNLYLNIYSGGVGTNHSAVHAGTLVFTTVGGSIRSQVIR